jgi:hypothetical protein
MLIEMFLVVFVGEGFEPSRHESTHKLREGLINYFCNVLISYFNILILFSIS